MSVQKKLFIEENVGEKEGGAKNRKRWEHFWGSLKMLQPLHKFLQRVSCGISNHGEIGG